jgi:DNA-directed RNA polymerase subunit RPC12/RpoP
MTKEEILDYFSDLNVVYNNPNKLDDLRKMLDKVCEKKTGKWILPNTEDAIKWGMVPCMICSECGERVSEGGNMILISYFDYKYCPYCGARLEVEK